MFDDERDVMMIIFFKTRVTLAWESKLLNINSFRIFLYVCGYNITEIIVHNTTCPLVSLSLCVHKVLHVCTDYTIP